MDERLKVGELAKRTGLTVRTLHHYDEIGLLEPAERTRAGHRLYGSREVLRLQQIASLRQLGLALDEIGRYLDRPDVTLEGVLELQIERLRASVARQERLCARLEELRARAARGETLSLDEVTRTIEATTMFERYFDADQLEALATRRNALGEEGMRAGAEAWARVMSGFEDAMEKGLEPSHPSALELAREARTLIRAFTGGDARLEASLREMYATEGAQSVMARQGVSFRPGLWQYMQKASEALTHEGGDGS